MGSRDRADREQRVGRRDRDARRLPSGLRLHSSRLRPGVRGAVSGRSAGSSGASASAGYLAGDSPTPADWRRFTTLLRFDSVYYAHFKCNKRRIVGYPSLWGFARELYQWPGVAETVDFDHIKRHYLQTHPALNPSRIVPLGPPLDFISAPHGREHLSA